MQFNALRRTTTFRLTVLYGLLFGLGTIALLGMVYLRSAGYLTQRVDYILSTEADALMRSPRAGLRERLVQELATHGTRTNVYGLFTAGGEHLAGNLGTLPPALLKSNDPVEIPPTEEFPASARLIARHLPGGEILVVGRDVSQLQQMRAIINPGAHLERRRDPGCGTRPCHHSERGTPATAAAAAGGRAGHRTGGPQAPHAGQPSRR